MMLKHGNGAPSRCAQNLLCIIRGEVPYARIKGLDRSFIDQPSELVAGRLAADIEYVLGTYEPRTMVNSVDIAKRMANGGAIDVTAQIE